MYWPNPSDFSRMLQTPRVAFRLPELKSCRIEKNPLGQPKPRSGNFATVYRGIRGDGTSVAIRAFNFGRDERRERYNAISEYLTGRNISSLMRFEYHQQGIRSAGDGKFYPLVTMEWVAGDTLFAWLQQQCNDRNTDAIYRAAEQWVELIDELRSARISHGDLQHGNVMVTDAGRLKLVDYDCMCVPALVGQRNLETGLVPYQHPGRDDGTRLSLELDHFSALLILVSLRALAAAPGLWRRHVENPEYDKLLFRPGDFLRPEDSELRGDLLNSPDETVPELTRALFDLYYGPMDEVPPLAEILDPFVKVEQLLSRRDWDGALELLQRKGVAEDVPPRLQPAVREAVDRVSCLRELQRAVVEGNEIDMQRLYLPGLLDDYPAAQPCVEVARQAGEVIPVLQQLKKARTNRAWQQFVQTWDDYGPLLVGRKSTEQYHREVETWRRRNETFAALNEVLARDPVDVEALLQCWNRLVECGGHPDAKRVEPRVKHLIRRERAWRAVSRVALDESSADVDEALVDAWDEQLLVGWPPAEPLRPRWEAARRRLELVSRLRRIADQSAGAMTVEVETALAETAAALPPSYVHSLSDRVRQASARAEAYRQLAAAVDQNGPESAIAWAWQNLHAAGGAVLPSEAQRERIELTRRRLPVLEQLRQIPLKLPPDKRDRRLLKVWRQPLLDDCADAQPWRAEWQDAATRRGLLDQLQAAILAHDDRAAAQVADHPLLAGYPLRPSWQAPIEQARGRVRAVARLTDVLAAGRREKFCDLFDAELLAKFADDLHAYHQRIVDWTRGEVCPLERIHLRPAFRSGLVRGDDGQHRLRWGWPRTRFTSQCLVTISPAEPTAEDDPEKIEAHYRATIDRSDWDRASGRHLVDAQDDWDGGYVAAWAKLDLGFTVLYSEPLLLGRLEAGQLKRRKKGSR